MEEDNNTGSRFTLIGEQYLQGIKNIMGVDVYDSNTLDIRDYMATRGRAVTWFSGVEGSASPATTTVLLGPRVNDAAIYEEYLHIQNGATRGWIGISVKDALIEEIQIGIQVLFIIRRVEVAPPSPALGRFGDLIVSLEGITLEQAQQIQNLVQEQNDKEDCTDAPNTETMRSVPIGAMLRDGDFIPKPSPIGAIHPVEGVETIDYVEVKL